MEEKKNKYVDKIIDFIFSNDERKWVILIFFIGLVLRILVAVRNPFNADEMVHGTHALGFISSGKLQIMDQDAVWFWLTDFFTKIFGSNMFGLRFLSILFGSFSIILVFMISRKFFNKKIAVLSTFIFALSPFQIIETRAEMDISMAFFVLLAIYLCILFFESGKQRYFLSIWISLGIAVMIKQIAITILPAFFIFFLYYNKKQYNKFKIKQIIYACLIILIMLTPVFTFNYLLYKDKGILDLQFARFTKIGFDTYQSIASTIQPFSANNLLFPHNDRSPGIVEGLHIIYYNEIFFITILALLGLFYFFKSKNKYKILIILSFLFPFVFLSGTSLLSTHFVFSSFYVSIMAGYGIEGLFKNLKKETNRKFAVYVLILLILIFAFANINKSSSKGFFGQNEINKLIKYKDNNIGENSLVVTDNRIYRGQTVFSFWNRHYIETNYFFDALNNIDKLPGNSIPLNIYFIECVKDDCGWGTIAGQPDLNASMENAVSFFNKNAQLISTINDVSGNPQFNIYHQVAQLKPSILNIADSTHSWFFYPVAYQPLSQVFDNYQIHSLSDRLLNQIAHFILYIDVITTLLLVIFLLYLFIFLK